MRIAFSAPPVPGHLNPMTTLARKLKSRGHDVIFVAFADAEPTVTAAGLRWAPLCEQEYPAGEMARRLQPLSSMSGPAAVEFTLQIFADSCRAILDNGVDALRESGADALVLDGTSKGLDLISMQLDLPRVNVSNALHFDVTGQAPLCIYDWPHETGPAALARNVKGVEAFGKMFARIVAIQRAYAEKVGLAIDWRNPYATASKLASISQTPKEFDFPSDHLAPTFHHAGPFHDGIGRPAAEFPYGRLTGESLIYASMGTLQNGSEQVFRIIVEAAQAPNRQLVLSVGNNVDPDVLLPDVAANTIVVQRAPQLEILKRAALCITHAGLNTALESLAEGVPMVAIPVTNDQPGVAARIAFTETGVFIPISQLTREKLRSAVDEVLTNPKYHENARQLQKAIQRTDGLKVAADLIEGAFRCQSTKQAQT